MVAVFAVAAVVCLTVAAGTWLLYAFMGADMTGGPAALIAFGLFGGVTLGAIAGIISLARRR